MNEWVWSNGGMILTGENWSAGRKTLHSVGGRWMNEYGAMVEWYGLEKLKFGEIGSYLERGDPWGRQRQQRTLKGIF